jgi:hypothetical protein
MYTMGKMVLMRRRRFDGRTIRVDKASDTGPRGGYGRGGGGGFGQRGGFGGPMMPQMPFGVHPQQQYPMAPPMYAQPYGRGGGYPPQMQQYGAPQAQGMGQSQTTNSTRILCADDQPRMATSSAVWVP